MYIYIYTIRDWSNISSTAAWRLFWLVAIQKLRFLHGLTCKLSSFWWIFLIIILAADNSWRAPQHISSCMSIVMLMTVFLPWSVFYLWSQLNHVRPQPLTTLEPLLKKYSFTIDETFCYFKAFPFLFFFCLGSSNKTAARVIYFNATGNSPILGFYD